jgi:MSHA pilin protein MshA
MNRKGFTLIELILVIAILGILAVSALPKFLDLSTNANQAARDGVVGAVRSGIALYRANGMVVNGNSSAPATLSNNFTEVLDAPVTGWTGTSPNFVHSATSSSYVYNATNGTFQ